MAHILLVDLFSERTGFVETDVLSEHLIDCYGTRPFLDTPLRYDAAIVEPHGMDCPVDFCTLLKQKGIPVIISTTELQRNLIFYGLIEKVHYNYYCGKPYLPGRDLRLIINQILEEKNSDSVEQGDF